jgi:hypothetical protein
MSTTAGQSKSIDWLTLATNLGVVIGLVLLVYEVRQSNKLAETQAYIQRLDQMQQTANEFGQSDYLPQIYLKIGTDMYPVDTVAELDSLTELERSRLTSWERGVMLRMSGHYYQYLQGYLDQQTGDQIIRDARTRLGSWNALGIEIEGQVFRTTVEAATER